MSILKFVTETPKSLEEMYRYITDNNKTIPEYTFGINISPFNALHEIELCRKLYPKAKQAHPYQQVIFSFDRNINISYSLAKYVCMQIGTVLGEDKFQVIGAIHFDKQPYDLHCHYIVHNTSIFGDTRGHGSNIFKLRERINTILLQNGLHTIPTFKDK